MQTLIASRFAVSLALSGVVGTVGLHLRLFPADNLLLALIQARRPMLYAGLSSTYATLWSSTPFFGLSEICAWLYIFVIRTHRHRAPQPLPPYLVAEARGDLFLVLDIVIPERGLFTGPIVVGAIDTGKTSAGLYPYVEQLLAYRANDAGCKISAPVLELKGDFCRHVREILVHRDRAGDHVEIRFTSRYRYNPFRNDLEASAHFTVAALMTSLFDRVDEFVWQQTSTNLVRFVILVHQVIVDYVTLFQVPERVIKPDSLSTQIAARERPFAALHRRRVIDNREHLLTPVPESDTWEVTQ